MRRIFNLRFIIFGGIGVFNTLFDLFLYIVLYNSTHSIVLANTVSTTVALIGSYLLNARLTFRSKRWTVYSLIGFIAVTLFGLWILQTAVIYVLAQPIRHLPSTSLNWLGKFKNDALTVLPKLLATFVTLIWNYLWYSKVIFKDMSKADQERLAAETL